MLKVYVEGLSIAGPGLPDWEPAVAVLAGPVPSAPAPTMPPVIDLLPPAERRRVSTTIKLALSVAQAAVRAAGREPSKLATIFVSSGGDGDTIHDILTT